METVPVSSVHFCGIIASLWNCTDCIAYRLGNQCGVLFRHGIGRSSTWLSTSRAHVLWTPKLSVATDSCFPAFSSAELHGVDSERPLGEGRFAVDICLHPVDSVEGYPASHNQLARLQLLRCHPQSLIKSRGLDGQLISSAEKIVLLFPRMRQTTEGWYDAADLRSFFVEDEKPVSVMRWGNG